MATNTKISPILLLPPEEIMTGQTWYSRFEKELKASEWYDDFYHERVLVPARKAAGLGESVDA